MICIPETLQREFIIPQVLWWLNSDKISHTCIDYIVTDLRRYTLHGEVVCGDLLFVLCGPWHQEKGVCFCNRTWLLVYWLWLPRGGENVGFVFTPISTGVLDYKDEIWLFVWNVKQEDLIMIFRLVTMLFMLSGKKESKSWLVARDFLRLKCARFPLRKMWRNLDSKTMELEQPHRLYFNRTYG